jgi:glycerophosphoryl diester phosphodiesterase
MPTSRTPPTRDPFKIASRGASGDVGLGATFQVPFETIEDVIFFGRGRIGILNDNNFPFSVGRQVGADRPDDTEMVLVDVGRNLGAR